MKKVRILFAGLHCDTNMGDPLICQTVMELWKNEFANREINIFCNLLDLRSLNRCENGFNKSVTKRSFLRRLDRLIQILYRWKPRLFLKMLINLKTKYVKELVEENDIIVICGGGIIHYTFHPYLIHISALIQAAMRYNKPVVLNSVGIEDYDTSDYQFNVFRHFLNMSCVKAFTTRDYIDNLRHDWLVNKSIHSDLVPDNAIVCADVFDVKRDEKSDIIGIGLIRKNIYDDFYQKNHQDKLIEFYVSMVKKMRKENRKFEFFTNGLDLDTNIILDIEKELGEVFDVRIPHSPLHLLHIIAGYKGIITARMHSTIVAYSLGVPFVALSWHKKLDKFNELIGKKESAIRIDEISSQQCLDLLDKNIGSGYDEGIRKKLSYQVYNSVSTVMNILDFFVRQ